MRAFQFSSKLKDCLNSKPRQDDRPDFKMMKVFARYSYLLFFFASVALGQNQLRQYDLNDTYTFGFNRKPCPSAEDFYSQPVSLTASRRAIGQRRAEAIKLKASAPVNGWEIKYVEPLYFGPEQFDRIGEYFTHREITWPYVYAHSPLQAKGLR